MHRKSLVGERYPDSERMRRPFAEVAHPRQQRRSRDGLLISVSDGERLP
jgi:hypothetical protein